MVEEERLPLVSRAVSGGVSNTPALNVNADQMCTKHPNRRCVMRCSHEWTPATLARETHSACVATCRAVEQCDGPALWSVVDWETWRKYNTKPCCFSNRDVHERPDARCGLNDKYVCRLRKVDDRTSADRFMCWLLAQFLTMLDVLVP